MNDAPFAATGRPAPDLTLPASDGREGALAELSGRKVALNFYP